LAKVCSKADQVLVYACGHPADVWRRGIEVKLARLPFGAAKGEGGRGELAVGATLDMVPGHKSAAKALHQTFRQGERGGKPPFCDGRQDGWLAYAPSFSPDRADGL